eukprot:6214624-Pleurochrysis_carterae.AAC.2
MKISIWKVASSWSLIVCGYPKPVVLLPCLQQARSGIARRTRSGRQDLQNRRFSAVDVIDSVAKRAMQRRGIAGREFGKGFRRGRR